LGGRFPGGLLPLNFPLGGRFLGGLLPSNFPLGGRFPPALSKDRKELSRHYNKVNKENKE